MASVTPLFRDEEARTPCALPILYERQQWVTWSAEGRAFDAGFLVRRFGGGPFVVSAVRDVRAVCISPGLCHDGMHHLACGVPRAEAIGHPQVVELAGTRSPFDGYAMRVSGRFLEPA